MKRALRLTVSFLVVCLLFSMLTACGGRTAEPKSKSYYGYFDTVATVSAYTEVDEAAFSKTAEAVRSVLADYHRLLDIYHSYEGLSNLYTLNASAGIAPVELDARLIEFLLYAKEVHALTGGRVNIAMGSVLSLWHECRTEALSGGESRLPDTEALTAARAHTQIDALVIDKAAGTAYISDPLVRLDVGALGKGYAVERAAEYLIAAGLTGYVINVGGNLRVVGTKADGSPFSTGIRDPSADGSAYIKTVMLSDTACVTSGNYERYYTVGGVKYHHIIDPATTYPAAYYASVTVITPDSALADALSTALFCMPREEAVSLVLSLEDARAVLVDLDGNVFDTAENTE